MLLFSNNYFSNIYQNSSEIELTYGVFNEIFLCFESYYKVTKRFSYKIVLYYGNFKCLFPWFFFVTEGAKKKVLDRSYKGLFFFQKVVISSRVSFISTKPKMTLSLKLFFFIQKNTILQGKC